MADTFLHKRGLTIGLLVNPLAGIGGATGNKGSDDEAIREQARAGDIPLRATQRAKQFFENLLPQINREHMPQWMTVAGDMGETLCQCFALPYSLIDHQPAANTSADDSRISAAQFLEARVDLILFVGGDGTARDICSVVEQKIPVLGVPSGVKMHSGVFAVSPVAAAKVIADLVSGKLTALVAGEVRDIDEQAFRSGQVRSRYFGEMLVPDENQFVQHVKQGGMEVEELVLLDMAADVRERIEEQNNFPLLMIFGPGSTTAFIQAELGLESTLLGVDAYLFVTESETDDHWLDVNADSLQKLVGKYTNSRLLITAIGGQGHIFGRGNQQLAPSVLQAIDKHNIWLVITKTKLEGLQQRPLLMDSSDSQLDADWSGLVPVICGYHDQVLYPLGLTSTPSTDALLTPLLAVIDKKLQAYEWSQSRRLFHGRGGCFTGLEWCCIDYFSPVLLITFFKPPPAEFENQLYKILLQRFKQTLTPDAFKVLCILSQKRYLAPAKNEVVHGEMPQVWTAHWQGLNFELSDRHQNIGFFLDAEPVRGWLQKNSKGLRVLNLFAYTCAFSVVACQAGAASVVNIDMSKSALATGRRNHGLNKLEIDRVRFLPHNIFKSWGKLRREGPYDLVIVDPPSFQKGSFVAVNDYQKVIRRLPSLLAEKGRVIACLNAPEIDFDTFRDWVESACGTLVFSERLAASSDFPDKDADRALKVAVFNCC